MADSTIKAKTIKRSDIKTYESVLENDNYLQSVYLQLIEIENLFHCLPDFIVQSNIMFNVAIDGIKDNYTPDIIIKTINDMAALIGNLKSNSIECLFFYRLIADRFEMQKAKCESDLKIDSERFKSGTKQLKPKAKFLMQKFDALFKREAKNFPIAYNEIPLWDWSKDFHGDTFKWYVYAKEQKETIDKLNNSLNQIGHIKWNGKNKNDLAYLLWKLQKENIISLNDFGLTLSKIFIDNEGSPIKNTLFNKYSSEFNNNKFPANANEIDKLIAILKKGID